MEDVKIRKSRPQLFMVILSWYNPSALCLLIRTLLRTKAPASLTFPIRNMCLEPCRVCRRKLPRKMIKLVSLGVEGSRKRKRRRQRTVKQREYEEMRGSFLNLEKLTCINFHGVSIYTAFPSGRQVPECLKPREMHRISWLGCGVGVVVTMGVVTCLSNSAVILQCVWGLCSLITNGFVPVLEGDSQEL